AGQFAVLKSLYVPGPASPPPSSDVDPSDASDASEASLASEALASEASASAAASSFASALPLASFDVVPPSFGGGVVDPSPAASGGSGMEASSVPHAATQAPAKPTITEATKNRRIETETIETTQPFK